MLASLTERYKHKILTPEELLNKVGAFPRKKKVIMCHGVFDVVHPGHIRHLLYARSKGDILVISITADRHIDKGIYRPHIPQELRAVNLAAFEFVDYVIIDPNPKPLENIALVRPDRFAKGYEYVASGMAPKTGEEAEVVQSYGGEMIFTPGDVVYSSSALIEASRPELKIDKLLSLMEWEGYGFDTLRDTVKDLTRFHIHVVGDLIVDTLTQTSMIGAQAKTPTISVLYESSKDYIGGAGIVSMHLRAAGAKVTFSTVLGEDNLKDFVLDGLKAAGVECKPHISPTRPTTNKTAIVAGGYRLLKLDRLDNRPISDNIVAEIADNIRTEKADAVIFSDFRHGIFNKRSLPALIGAIPAGMFKVGDSQIASRWGNILDFHGFDLITPNEREARFALGDQDSGVRALADRLYDAAECKTLILKMGDRGVLTCRSKDHESLGSFCVIDSFTEKLVDPVGAGDALLAYSTLSMLATGKASVAAIIGSMAAACECERDGNIPITPEDVLAKIDAVEKMAQFS